MRTSRFVKVGDITYLEIDGVLVQPAIKNDDVDKEVSTTSDNAVANAAITNYVNEKLNTALKYEIVDELPTEDIDTHVVYMILNTTAEAGNTYDEYMYINNQWELIGTTATTTNYAFPTNWPTTNQTTTKQFCDVVNADINAVAGMSYLGEVRWNDLPFSGNAEVVVEIMSGTGTSNKVIHLILSSGNVVPYRWEYTYWSNGSQLSGWIGFQPEITSSNKLSSDLVSDTGHTNKFVTSSEKSTWNAKQDALPTVVNDKFLHTNASTGALEWSNVETLQEITYTNLVSLRANSQLVKGRFYRITDYNTIINGTYDLSIFGAAGYLHYAKSAEHQFDIIVQAIDVNKLNENARAIQHSGDNYFVNNNLSAWELKYTLDNDATTYSWANSTSGKGVIYYMKDEFNNEAWYDFKNIQFLAYALTNEDTNKSLVYDSEDQPLRYGSVFHLIMALMSYMSSGEYSTPFNGGYDFYVGATILGAVQSSTVDSTYLSTFNADWYYTFGGSSDLSLDGIACSNNKLSQMPDPLTYYAWLQNIITMSSVIDYGLPINILNGVEIKNNYFGYNSVVNIFGSGTCLNNQLVCNDYGNILGNNCYSNTFGNNCQSNTFGNNCQSNTFGNSCSYNTFGDSFISNTFNNYCSSNTFDNYCQSNIFGTNCSSNTFGDSFNSNTFDNYCQFNIFGDDCWSNTFGYNCSSNTFGYYCRYHKLGDSCYFNTFGANCDSNIFSSDCTSNTFGISCSSNTFGISCSSNTFGISCSSNSFSDNCDSNTFGDNCSSNTFGNSCSDNKLGDSITPLAYNYQRYNIFENGVSFVELRSASADGANNNNLQNVKVCQGVHGTSSAVLKTITATRNLDYQVEYKATGSTEILV